MIKTFLTEVGGNITEEALDSIILSYNLPAGIALKTIKAIVKSSTQSIISNCYDDITHRQLSSREAQKHNSVFEIAIRTFIDCAHNDNVESMFIISDDAQYEYAYEVAEHLSMEAIRQSEQKKIDILGRFYGKQFYEGRMNWQDMHQVIAMTGELSYRQIILIKLICERFSGMDQESYISNPSACVEINRLLDYGIWRREGAAFSTDNSNHILLKRVNPTEYAKLIYDVLMLNHIESEDIERTIESLHIVREGIKVEILTQEEYKQHTEWTDL